jgi:hypothetical protein
VRTTTERKFVFDVNDSQLTLTIYDEVTAQWLSTLERDAKRYRGLRTAYLEKWFYFPCEPFDTARAETEQDCDNALDAYLAKVRKA